ncbi:MAG: hypothetical protein QNJ92_06465 [Alphaproteobacteria bacterium]|nr:hypothetical protein [Alphaproteobacteria bacterium]
MTDKKILYSATIIRSDGVMTRGVTLHNGNSVIGGSNEYYHVGTRTIEDGRIKIAMNFSTYSDREFGDHVEFSGDIEGDFAEERMTLEGEVELPTGPISLMVKLIKQREID